jgi:hypothetical protein
MAIETSRLPQAPGLYDSCGIQYHRIFLRLLNMPSGADIHLLGCLSRLFLELWSMNTAGSAL